MDAFVHFKYSYQAQTWPTYYMVVILQTFLSGAMYMTHIVRLTLGENCSEIKPATFCIFSPET